MDWKSMTGEERYRVVEMARKGEASMKDLCEMFGVSRQTLSLAMEKVERAALESLESRRPGRKGKSEEEKRITELSRTQSSLEKDLKHWKTRYEVAQAFIDLTREQEKAKARAERNRRLKKKARSGAGPAAGAACGDGPGTGMAEKPDGVSAGDRDVEH